jgi:regulator of CtrA degradation
MSLAQANKEKTKVKLSISDSTDEDAVKLLPERLSELIEQSRMLLVKVRRLDATIHAPVPDQPTSDHPLNQQLGLLKAAFERDGN